MPESVSYQDILAAQKAIEHRIVCTPCPRSYLLSDLLDCEVYCKLEYLQHTGSFKERGAANALLRMDCHEAGVIAASAGNHALALAYHGRMLQVPVTVVMPTHAPFIKVDTCRRLGASVIQYGTSFSQATQHAQELSYQKCMTYIHGFENAHVIAGQGTMGLEILQQVPNLDAILVPVGGGGLIAGVSAVIKAVKPQVHVIGVELDRMPLFSCSLKDGQAATLPIVSTLADGLTVGRMGDMSLALASQFVDRVVSVSESDLALAVLRLLELEKAVVEGAGAASLAAIIAGKVPELKGKTVVLPLCGGNIDPLVLRRVIEFGMSVDQRLCRINVSISDRPGGLATLAAELGNCGVSIHEIRHERIFAGPDVNRVLAQLVIEVRSGKHLQVLIQTLHRKGYDTNVFRPDINDSDCG